MAKNWYPVIDILTCRLCAKDMFWLAKGRGVRCNEYARPRR